MSLELITKGKTDGISSRDTEKQSENEFNELPELKDDANEILKPDISFIEKSSLPALIEQNHSKDIKWLSSTELRADANENKHEGLTDEEKANIKEAHPDWPDEIIDAIGSWKEYEIYDKANLKVEYINGKPCLIRTDIDMNLKDADGLSNIQRIEHGLAPIGSDGKPINLHHIGQHKDSPLAELTATEHKENYGTLHPYQGPTEVHGECNTWDAERRQHWKTRANEL